jgi:hypothetical protein
MGCIRVPRTPYADRQRVAVAARSSSFWSSLDPGPDRRRVAALGERLVDVRHETTETLLERGLHIGEGPI